MPFYEDLAAIDYFKLKDTTRLRAVGWLARGHRFEVGQVERADFARLFSLLDQPWQPYIYLGSHDCDLCATQDGPGSIELDGHRVAIGSANLFLPGQGVVFVAPSMILHYIGEHDYKPPEPFLDAVRRCHPLDSSDYLVALEREGGTGITLYPRADLRTAIGVITESENGDSRKVKPSKDWPT